MSNDLREELENALQGTELLPSSGAASTPEPTVPTPSPEGSAPAAPTPTEAPVDLNAMAEKPRDEAGRFVPKAAAPEGIVPGPKGNQPPVAAPEAGLPPPEQARPIDRAPQGWTPSEREKWASLPDDIKARVVQREREINIKLNETAEARKFAEAIQQTITPYMAMIQSEGGTPVTAIASLFQTAGALRTAPPLQKAQLVASLVKQFGIDINMLDQAIVGQGPGVDPIEERINQRVNQAIAPIQQRYQQMEMQQQQEMAAQQAQVHNTVAQFVDSQAYGDVVRGEMAMIMRYAAENNINMTLEECYRRACQMNPQVAALVGQQQQNQQLQQQNQAAQNARGRAVSISGAPTGGGMEQVQQGDDIRSAIEASLAQMTR